MKIKNIALLLISLILISCEQTEKEASTISILAYYVPKADTPPDQLPLEKLTHIIFSFTKVIDGEMKFRNPESGEKLKQLVAQKQFHPDLKVMIACGGWGADGFSDMAYTEENRQKFVKSVIEFIEEYQLDGIDIDWEYPGIPAAETKNRIEDKQNFTLLMKELREQLDALDRKQTLTFASAGWKRYYEHIELTEVMKYADYMNVMTYDQIGASSPYTGHHTALGKITMDDLKAYPVYNFIESKKEEMAEQGIVWEPQSVEEIISYCLELGVQAQQLIVGAAFYGRSWKGVGPDQNGLYQVNNGAFIGGVPYSQIRKEFELKNGYKRYWDSIAKAPFLYNPTDSIFFSYDDTASVKLKTWYAMKQKLGGIMFWQLSHDTKEKSSLLDAIYKASQAGK